MENPHERPKAEVSSWARWMAHYRQDMRGCVVRCELADGEQHFLIFVYAVQSPCLVCLALLQAALVPEPWFDAQSWHQVEAITWDHAWALGDV